MKLNGLLVLAGVMFLGAAVCSPAKAQTDDPVLAQLEADYVALLDATNHGTEGVIGHVVGVPGQIVNLPVQFARKVAADPAVTAAQFFVYYDPSLIEFVGIAFKVDVTVEAIVPSSSELVTQFLMVADQIRQTTAQEVLQAALTTPQHMVFQVPSSAAAWAGTPLRQILAMTSLQAITEGSDPAALTDAVVEGDDVAGDPVAFVLQFKVLQPALGAGVPVHAYNLQAAQSDPQTVHLDMPAELVDFACCGPVVVAEDLEGQALADHVAALDALRDKAKELKAYLASIGLTPDDSPPLRYDFAMQRYLDAIGEPPPLTLQPPQ